MQISWQAFWTRRKHLATKTRCITFFININTTIVTFNIIIIIILIMIIYSLIFLRLFFFESLFTISKMMLSKMIFILDRFMCFKICTVIQVSLYGMGLLEHGIHTKWLSDVNALYVKSKSLILIVRIVVVEEFSTLKIEKVEFCFNI